MYPLVHHYNDDLTNTTIYGSGWAGTIYSYVKSTGLYKCPDDSTNGSGTKVPVSYYFNEVIGRNDYACISGAMSQFTAPAKTVLLFEDQGNTAPVTDPREAACVEGCSRASNGFNEVQGNGGGSIVTGYGAAQTRTGFASSLFTGLTGLHTDGSNYLMADGHAKWLRDASVSTGWIAATPTSLQDTNTNVGSISAAGTEVNTFAATFSPM